MLGFSWTLGHVACYCLNPWLCGCCCLNPFTQQSRLCNAGGSSRSVYRAEGGSSRSPVRAEAETSWLIHQAAQPGSRWLIQTLRPDNQHPGASQEAACGATHSCRPRTLPRAVQPPD